MADSEILIEVRGLKKHFPIRGGLLSRSEGAVKAVDDVSLYIRKGETLGLVGESGCGKTTTGRCILHLTKPTGGNVYWKMPDDARKRLDRLEAQETELEARLERDRDKFKDHAVKKELEEVTTELESIRKEYSLEGRSPEELRLMRKNMQIVFQDPYSSLNPRMLIKDIVGEPLLIHGVAKGEEIRERAMGLMEVVGLNPEHLYRFPHEFSGGQRQRIGVARALALNPEFVVLDEPTSALDMSVQAQILNMLNDLQDAYGLTYLFISHDLSTIHYMCDRVSVMYLGKIVESASKEDLFNRPLHPYTQALLSAIPVPDPDLKKERVPLAGEIPSPANPPTGCRFHTRCKLRQARCEVESPPLIDIGNEHFVACHFGDKK
ncbi:MAG: ATP-binding cassette domain-containing protein [Methanomassiliicoccus sp.]|nr:ATP-binding cassette domain-containing protein [Methanomassiliicoccus sp.]